MNPAEHNGHESVLDAYLDGMLTANDRAQFTLHMRDDPGLRDAVDRQAMIDGCLTRRFAPLGEVVDRVLTAVRQRASVIMPEVAVPPLKAQRGARSEQSAPQGRRRETVLALAAAIALVVVAGWQIWEFVKPQARPFTYEVQAWRSMDRIYRDEVAGGFQPKWVCKNDDEFAAATRRELGQPVLLAQVPGITALGWSYANTLLPNTLYLLATVEEAKVLVFMQPSDSPRRPIVSPESGLHLHRRQVNRVVLYELSELPVPRVLPHFFEP